MKPTIEQKIKVLARAFYQDNKNQYEDYREALTEFSNRQNTSTDFIEFGVKPYLKTPDKNTSLYIREEDGHLALVRNDDGFFEPVFEMTEEEGEAIEEKNHEVASRFPDEPAPLSTILELMGWKELEVCHQ